jgi:hypothetical protein
MQRAEHQFSGVGQGGSLQEERFSVLIQDVENYIYLAGDPERVEKQRAMQCKNIRAIRAKASGISTVDAISDMLTRQTAIKDQVEILIAVWEQVSESAQDQFLQTIGAKL